MGFRKRKTYVLCFVLELPINNPQFIWHFGHELMNLESYLERLASTKQDPDVKKSLRSPLVELHIALDIDIS